MLGGSLDGKGVWENRCMYMYGPVSLLCTRSYHNLVNRLLKKKFTVTITILSWKKKILGILNATKRYQIRSDQSLSRVRLFATP